MKILPVVALALSITVWAQLPFQLPPSANPDTVVATINKKPVTAAELRAMLSAYTPDQQKSILNNPKASLQQFEMTRTLEAMAVKEQLDQQSPTKEALEMSRRMTLAQAMIKAAHEAIPVSADDQKKYYETNRDKYTKAKVKMLFVAFRSGASPITDPKAKKVLTEPEAKAKVEKLLIELRGGRADFVKMVKDHSDDADSVARDGDFGQPISLSDKSIPAEISKAIFALKPGQFSDPVRQATGFYLFRLEELITQPFDQVRDDIFTEIQDARFREWMVKIQSGIEVKIENDEFFKSAAAGK